MLMVCVTNVAWSSKDLNEDSATETKRFQFRHTKT